jgi:DNA-binding HxlR family transcriptional regulator/putative sterol carrier protein
MRRRSHTTKVERVSKRTYGQYCALARAFDVIGERWTPLLLRELALGPRRYADLLEGLPGIGTSLLASRLRDLEYEGVICRRRLPPPAARDVYDLTDSGRELAEALVPLARWGAKRMGTRGKDEVFQLEWFLLYMRSVVDPAATVGVHDAYEFHIDDDVFHVIVDDGSIDAQNGPAPRPADLVVATDYETFMGIGSGQLWPGDAKVLKRMHVDGDPTVAQRCMDILAPVRIEADA